MLFCCKDTNYFRKFQIIGLFNCFCALISVFSLWSIAAFSLRKQFFLPEKTSFSPRGTTFSLRFFPNKAIC